MIIFAKRLPVASTINAFSQYISAWAQLRRGFGRFRYHYFVVFGHRRRCLIFAVYNYPRGSSGPLRLLSTLLWSYPRHGSRSGHPRPHWGRHRYSYHGRRLEHSHPPRNALYPSLRFPHHLQGCDFPPCFCLRSSLSTRFSLSLFCLPLFHYIDTLACSRITCPRAPSHDYLDRRPRGL